MSLLYALEGLRSPFLDAVFGAVTYLGDEIVYMAMAVIVYWCFSKPLGYYILTSGFTGTILNQFMKITFRIPRPWVLDPEFQIVESAREAATGYSFPSGHTQNAFASFGSLAAWTRRGWLRAVGIAAVLLVAFSRMYLGVHTPLDVGVAFAMGLALTLALLPLFRDIEEHPGRMYGLIGGMIAICAAYLLYVELWPFPADVDAANLASARENGYKLLGAASGMLLSFWLDRKYIHFDVKAPLAGQILKCVPGLAIVLAIKSGLKAPLIALLGTGGAADAARYFLVVLFAAGVWPMTFRFFASVGRKKERS